MPKIVDAFIFFNEIPLLKYRLSVLGSVVDYFVIVESDRTFTGTPKPIFYKPSDFEQYQSKIIHVVVNQPEKADSWSREARQRNAIFEPVRNLALLPIDLLLLSDVDEIPDPQFLKDGFPPIGQPLKINMDMYYYNLTVKAGKPSTTATILPISCLTSDVNDLVRRHKPGWGENMRGWHLSYFMSIRDIIKKIESFSHTEFNKKRFKSKQRIQKLIAMGHDLFDRDNKKTHQFSRLALKNNFYLPPQHHILMEMTKSQRLRLGLSLRPRPTRFLNGFFGK